MKQVSCLILFSIILTSCLKKYGCKDNDAINFDLYAEHHDNSCIYETQGVLYWASSTYYNLFQDSGSVTISAYLDNEFIGSDQTINWVSNTPDCDEFVPISFNDTIYSETVYKRLMIKDQSEKILVDEIITIYKDCNYIQIP